MLTAACTGPQQFTLHTYHLWQSSSPATMLGFRPKQSRAGRLPVENRLVCRVLPTGQTSSGPSNLTSLALTTKVRLFLGGSLGRSSTALEWVQHSSPQGAAAVSALLPCPRAQPVQLWRHTAVATLEMTALQRGCAAVAPKALALLVTQALQQGCAPPKALSQPRSPAMACQAAPLVARPWQGAAAHHVAWWVRRPWHPAGMDWTGDRQEAAVTGGWRAASCPQHRGPVKGVLVEPLQADAGQVTLLWHVMRPA